MYLYVTLIKIGYFRRNNTIAETGTSDWSTLKYESKEENSLK